MDLTGDDLQKIEVGPKEIDFSDVFKNSEQRKTFWVQNNLRTAIFVSLENDIDFLKRSNPKSMVIPSGARQGFNLILFSTVVRPDLGNMSIKYTINYKPTCTFKLNLKANVIPVTIKKLNDLNKFQFKNEKVHDRVEMSLTQKLDFLNQGNAAADFYWDPPKDKIFSIEPMSGKIAKGSKFTMEVTFTPKSEIYKHDPEEDLKLNLVNGAGPMLFRATGTVNQAQCKLAAAGSNNTNAEVNVLNFDYVHIGVEESKEFIIKNDRSSIAAYSIVNPEKDILTFKESSGYIGSFRTVLVTIKCKEQRINWVSIIYY